MKLREISKCNGTVVNKKVDELSSPNLFERMDQHWKVVYLQEQNLTVASDNKQRCVLSISIMYLSALHWTNI